MEGYVCFVFTAIGKEFDLSRLVFVAWYGNALL